MTQFFALYKPNDVEDTTIAYSATSYNLSQVKFSTLKHSKH